MKKAGAMLAFFMGTILYICTTKLNYMANRITLMMSEANIKKVKKIAAKRKSSVSRIMEDYVILLDKIEERIKKEELSPFVKRFGGLVNTGKNETKESILANRFEK